MSDDFESQLFVPVWEGPYAEASERLRWLEAAHIPVDLDDAVSAGHARVVVDPGYVNEARRIMWRGPQEILEYPMVDTTSQWFTNWKVIVAVLVLIGIVLVYVF